MLFFLLGLIFLSACSSLPIRLKSTAEKSMFLLNSELNVTIENLNYIHPIMTDTYQLGEEKWCLTYELGPQFRFSSLWEKQEQDWVQLELRPFVENCNWAR